MPRESTSPEVAAIAARIVAASDSQIVAMAVHDAKAIRSVAASALTQREPEPWLARIKRALRR